KVAGASPATRTNPNRIIEVVERWIIGEALGRMLRSSIQHSTTPPLHFFRCARSSKRAGGFITRIALDECLDPERYRTRVPFQAGPRPCSFACRRSLGWHLRPRLAPPKGQPMALHPAPPSRPIPADRAAAPPESPRSLPVVPLIPDKRYYGEAPMRLRRDPHAVWWR